MDRERRHSKSSSEGHRGQLQRQKSERGGVLAGNVITGRWVRSLEESKKQHEEKVRIGEIKKQKAIEAEKERRSSDQLKRERSIKHKEVADVKQKDRRMSEPSSSGKERKGSSSSSSKQASGHPPKPRAFLRYMASGESDNSPLLKVNATKDSAPVVERSRRSSTSHSHRKKSTEQEDEARREARRARRKAEEAKLKEAKSKEGKGKAREKSDRPRSSGETRHRHHRHRRDEPPREESKLKGIWKAIAAH